MFYELVNTPRSQRVNLFISENELASVILTKLSMKNMMLGIKPFLKNMTSREILFTREDRRKMRFKIEYFKGRSKFVYFLEQGSQIYSNKILNEDRDNRH